MDFKRRTYRSDRLNTFAVRHIRDRQKDSSKILEILKKIFSYKLLTPRNAIIGSIIVACVLLFMAYNLIQGVKLRNVVFSFGKDLAEDQYGHTNILLLGTGGGNHEGADLTDTIILASIDQKTNQATLLSIPRDLYIEDLPNKKFSGTRINNLYHIGKNELGDEELGLKMLRDQIKIITNMDVHYFVKVEFAGFKEMVDALGGVDINVPNTIIDTEYPIGESQGYETFALQAGMQHLDGETALKYSRSRHSTNDFDRSKRQQLVIYAMKEKAEKMGILSDSGKVKSLYDSLGKYMETDLSVREIITLAKIGTQIKQDQIATYTIHDDPTKCGGLLYTPLRELYGGASVLIPAAPKYEDIHRLTDIVLNHPEFKNSNIKLQILNGTKGLGIAAETKIILNRICLNVARFGNGQSKNVTKTTYYLKSEIPQSALDALQELIPGEISHTPPQKYLDIPYASEAQIIVEIGQDYLAHKLKDPYDGIVDLIPKATSAPITGEATGKTATTTTKTASGSKTTPVKTTSPTATSKASTTTTKKP
ncbi:MAG: LCP family protein [Candidatus Peregrinibacteria bacterium]|nr:LCP family protein [Candidatus Peregrinibacteria bacterium]